MFGQHYLIISDLSANGPTKWKKHMFAGVMLEDMKRSIECHSDWFIGIHTRPAQARSYFYTCNILFIWNYFTNLSCAVTALSEYIQEHVCVCVSKKWFQIMWWLLLVFWEMLFTSPFLWSFFQWLPPLAISAWICCNGKRKRIHSSCADPDQFTSDFKFQHPPSYCW